VVSAPTMSVEERFLHMARTWQSPRNLPPGSRCPPPNMLAPAITRLSDAPTRQVTEHTHTRRCIRLHRRRNLVRLAHGDAHWQGVGLLRGEHAMAENDSGALSSPASALPQDKRCLIIYPMGEPNSKIRDKADEHYHNVIKPVLDDEGYSFHRAGESDQIGDIPTQVLLELVRVNLVIADLTGPNASVLYELAFRHIAGKPAIQVFEGTNDQLPIYVRNLRTVFIKDDNWVAAKKALTAQVQASMHGEAGPMPYLTEIGLYVKYIGGGTRGAAELPASVPPHEKPSQGVIGSMTIPKGRLKRGNDLLNEAITLLQRAQGIREAAANADRSDLAMTLELQADSLENIAQDIVASVQTNLSKGRTSQA
jgi:hypothetical protein